MYKKTWWLNPIVVYLLLMIIVFGAFGLSETDYYNFFRAGKFINIEHVFVYILSFLFFMFGVLAAKKYKLAFGFGIKQSSKFSESQFNMVSLRKAYRIMYALCLGAYIVWIINFGRIHGLSSLGVLFSITAMSDSMYIFKYNTGQIAGITSFTEIAMLVIPLGVYLWFSDTNKKNRRKYFIQIVVLILISLARSVIFSERIALIEVMIPLIVTFLACTKNKKFKMYVALGPVIGIACLVVVFGLMEYSRSWLHYYVNVYSSYGSFLENRLLGYYYNSINTECLIIEKLPSLNVPYFSITWIWKLPGMNGLLNMLSGIDLEQVYKGVLASYSNPDYTNCGGMLTFYKDFGVFFGIFQFCFGYIVGRLYKWFIKGGILSVVVYSYVYVGLLELPRYFFYGNTRSISVYIGIVILLVMAKRKEKRQNGIEQEERAYCLESYSRL